MKVLILPKLFAFSTWARLVPLSPELAPGMKNPHNLVGFLPFITRVGKDVQKNLPYEIRRCGGVAEGEEEGEDGEDKVVVRRRKKKREVEIKKEKEGPQNSLSTNNVTEAISEATRLQFVLLWMIKTPNF